MSVTINNPLTIVKQQAEASGKKITTGTYQTGPSREQEITITHGLGVKPNLFIFTAIYPATDTVTVFVLYINTEVYPAIYRSIKYTGNGTSYAHQAGQTLPTNITETEITVSSWNPTYRFAPDAQYTWIAIE